MFIIFHFHSRYAEQDSKQKQSTKQRGTKRNNNGVGTIYMCCKCLDVAHWRSETGRAWDGLTSRFPPPASALAALSRPLSHVVDASPRLSSGDALVVAVVVVVVVVAVACCS
ncbi:uncharacterized protein LOC132787860 isoform X1 [Drosophila nasuta]|uniref:uncharacterized protein LOC132787860 isoform X1 n=1 Tax=Drosophila nasuta TaxID=42062 RepID=UPI00295E7189|nr:uncharacterized protein LOC132787860 isoform X1 [Drosophila nasuta]